MTDVRGPARRLLEMYLLPSRDGHLIVAAVVMYAAGSGLYLAGGTVFFLRGIHLSDAQLGLGLTVGGLAGFVTTVPVCMLATRLGPLRLLRMLQVWRAASLAALAFADNFYTFTLLVTLFLVSQGPVFPMAQLVVAGVVGDHDQTRSLGVVGAVANVGISAGAIAAAPFLGWGSLWGYRTILLLGSLCCLAAAGLYGMLSSKPAVPAGARSRWAGGLVLVARDRRYLALTVVSGLLYLHTVLLSVGLPLWLVQFTDAPAGLLSVLVTMNTVLVILIQVQVARRIRGSPDGVRALRYAGFSLAAFCVVLITSAHARSLLTAGLLMLATVLLTGGELLQGAGSWDLSYRHAPPALRTEYLSVFALGTAGTGIIGPEIVALIVSWRAPGLVALCAFFLATGIAITLIGARLAHTGQPGAPAAQTAEAPQDGSPALETDTA